MKNYLVSIFLLLSINGLAQKFPPPSPITDTERCDFVKASLSGQSGFRNSNNERLKNIPLTIKAASTSSFGDVTDVRVFPTVNMQATPSISVNKQNPNNLVISSETYTNAALTTQGYFYSNDGGLSWNGSEQLQNNNLLHLGVTPATSYNSQGRGYIAGVTNGLGQGYVGNQSSTDGGATWSNAIMSSGNLFATFSGMSMTGDNEQYSPYPNNVYSVWGYLAAGDQYVRQVEFTRSQNNGQLFEIRKILSNSRAFDPDVQTGPNGEVYVCWNHVGFFDPSLPAKGLGFCRSLDGGGNFTTAQQVLLYNGIRKTLNPDPLFNNTKVLGRPSMGVDKSQTLHRGRIYVSTNIQENGNGKAIVQVSYSDDKGDTWSTPVTVSISNGRQNWNAKLAVDDCNGDIWVIYYSLDGATGFSTNTYLARSADGGATWENQKVSDVSHVTAPIFGTDPNFQAGYAGWYLSVAAYGGKVYPVWTDNRSGNWQLYCSPITTTACVPTCAIISPKGPIDYYYNSGEFFKTFTFTSSTATGNQWYVDGVSVNGATNATFDYNWSTTSNTDETHQISVKNNNCMSGAVVVHFLPNGGMNSSCPIPITNHCFLPIFNTPVNYCESSNSYMRTVDMGPSATYSWQFLQPNNQPSNLISITSQNQNVAYISVAPFNYQNGGNVVEVIAKSELNGYTKYFQYTLLIWPSTNAFHGNVNWPLQGCNSPTSANITLSTQGSWLDNEFYDFGNADVISVSPALSSPYYSTQHTVYMSGAFTNQPRVIVLKRNGINSYTSNFTNDNYGDCWNSTNTLFFNNNCLVSKNSNTNGEFGANNQFYQSKIIEKSFGNELERESSLLTVQSIEIYNTAGQLVKRSKSDIESYEILRSNKVSDLVPGLYLLRIMYKDKTFTTIKKFLQ